MPSQMVIKVETCQKGLRTVLFDELHALVFIQEDIKYKNEKGNGVQRLIPSK